MWKFNSVRLEIVLLLMQDRCMVCAERTIGLEIGLDAADGTPRWRGSLSNPVSDSLEIVLVSVQDRCTVCAKHTTGLDIVFNAATMVLLGDEAQVEAHFSPCGDSANLDAR